jgi:NAD kinase
MSALEFYYQGRADHPELNQRDRDHNEALGQLEAIVKRNGAQHKLVTRVELPRENFADYDLVISAGGDGTVIATAAYNESTPQVNIHTEKKGKSKGVLCIPHLEDIEAILQGRYNTEHWTRQDLHQEGSLVARALNETCVGEKGLNFSKMAGYDLKFRYPVNGQELQDQQYNSGLIVVTGTGSSAWPALFLPQSRTCDYLMFATVLPYQGLMNSGKTDYLEVCYKKFEGTFAADTIARDFPLDSKLVITISDRPLPVLVPK